MNGLWSNIGHHMMRIHPKDPAVANKAKRPRPESLASHGSSSLARSNKPKLSITSFKKKLSTAAAVVIYSDASSDGLESDREARPSRQATSNTSSPADANTSSQTQTSDKHSTGLPAI